MYHVLNGTSLSTQRRYDSHDFFRERWDVLQSTYSCCGGHQAGFRDYANEEGVVKAVPDSCCKEISPGCGRVSANFKK